MMTSLSLNLQTAVYQRLSGYAPLTAIVGTGVYDMPPSTAKYPYVTIGEDDVHQADVGCKRSYRVILEVHGWSDHRGYKEVKSIVQAVEDALHDFPLIVDGYRLISLTLRDTQFMRAPDGLLSHSISDFVAYIEAL